MALALLGKTITAVLPRTADGGRGGSAGVVAGNRGPQEGWPRWRFIVLVTVLALQAAVLLRLGLAYFRHTQVDITWWHRCLMDECRFSLMAAPWLIVLEYCREEAGTVLAMQEAELDRLALDREMAQARQAQIEPHFLFNTLANVRRLCQTDRERVELTLDAKVSSRANPSRSTRAMIWRGARAAAIARGSIWGICVAGTL